MNGAVISLLAIVNMRKGNSIDLSSLEYPWNIVVEISSIVFFVATAIWLIKMIKNIFPESEV